MNIKRRVAIEGRGDWGAHLWCYRSTALHFNCPNCNTLYRIIKAEAGSETVDREITCRACGGGPLAGRQGNFVLKYFLLRKGCLLMAALGQAPSEQSHLWAISVHRLTD